jgi:ABC-type maltose transport system permease subunit
MNESLMCLLAKQIQLDKYYWNISREFECDFTYWLMNMLYMNSVDSSLNGTTVVTYSYCFSKH